MIRLPSSLMIMGKEYKIKKVNLPDNADSGWIEDDIIHVNLANISATRPKEDLLYTLGHEIGHAIFRRAGFIQAVDPKLEEVMVDTFAKVFVELFDMKFRTHAIEPLS